MLSASSYLEVNWSDTAHFITDCASTPSSPGLSPTSSASYVDGTSIASSISSEVSNPFLEITSPDIAAYYGAERYPHGSKRKVLHRHAGSSGGCKRQRLLESHLEVQLLPSIVDVVNRKQNDRAHRLYRWLWNIDMPSKFSPDHRRGEGSSVPAVRCWEKVRKSTSNQRAALTDTRGAKTQPTIVETTISAVRSKVDRLLARAAHEQGHIPNIFWQNKSLRKALRLLAEAKPMGYTAPCRTRIGGALRVEVFAEVNLAVAEVADDCDVITGSSDGWDNVSSTHFLSQMGMIRKGSFFEGGVHCTGVETMNKPWVFAQLEDSMFYSMVWKIHCLKTLLMPPKPPKVTRLVGIRNTSRARRSWRCCKNSLRLCWMAPWPM